MRKCKFGEYDEKSKESIFKYATLLKDKSLLDLYPEEIKKLPEKSTDYKGKGDIGTMVEYLHFNYQPNSNVEPDFKDACLELKTTPLKITKKRYVSKERLVLGMIDYFQITKEQFERSSFLKKNSSLLLLFYLYEKGKDLDQIFKLIKLWDIPKSDLKIIKQDWTTIYTKIKSGLAHELSGGDTLYLEAARKGAGGLKDFTRQPYSEEKAKRRAFAFKSKYVNQIIDSDEDFVSAIDDTFEHSKQTFEEYIIEKFKPFVGMSINEISDKFGLSYSAKKKDIVAAISKTILGVPEKYRITEFEKADILIKTVTLENNGILKESMPFQRIDYHEIVNEEEWEESNFYQRVINRKFFLVIFKKDIENTKRLFKVMFWNIPERLRRLAEQYWRDVKEKTEAGDMGNFWKLKDKKGFHVRPKARDSKDLTTLRDGTAAPKLGYWINSEEIKSVVTS